MAAVVVLAVGAVLVVAAAHRSTAPAPGRGTAVSAGARASPPPRARTGAAGVLAPVVNQQATGTLPPATGGPQPAAMAAADQFVRAYAGFDWRHPSGDPAAWKTLVTPGLYNQLSGPSASPTGMTAAQVADHETGVPDITSTTWVSGGADSAAVLVDCALTVTGDATGGPTTSLTSPYPLTLVNAFGRWLVSSIGETRVGGSSSPAP